MDSSYSLYTGRLEKLDKEEDAGTYQRLQRKLNLVASRAARYDPSKWGHP
jgi:hypothetical protein